MFFVRIYIWQRQSPFWASFSSLSLILLRNFSTHWLSRFHGAISMVTKSHLHGQRCQMWLLTNFEFLLSQVKDWKGYSYISSVCVYWDHHFFSLGNCIDWLRSSALREMNPLRRGNAPFIWPFSLITKKSVCLSASSLPIISIVIDEFPLHSFLSF